MEAASQSAGFAAHTVLAIESEKERMEERYGALVRYSQKDYGDKYLNMFCHESALQEEANHE